MGADMTKGSLTKNGGETGSPKEMVDLYPLLIGRFAIEVNGDGFP
jgi:hypothetical protein